MLTASGWPFAKDVLRHSVLPALSLVLAAVGFWALGMRGMMVGTVGEDYIALAEANGLRPQTIFFRYAMRNAILPQYTALALSLGYVVSGQVAVEVVFNYPGIGALLFRAIVSSDYNLINGIVFLTILSIGVITVALDLSYPLLDPRIRHRGDAP
jgi:peptide/nickel transport system permease protein